MEDEGPPPAAAQVEDGPLLGRIESKAWKTRMDAYVELAQVRSCLENGGTLALLGCMQFARTDRLGEVACRPGGAPHGRYF